MEPHAEWETRLPSPPLRPLADRYVGYRLAGYPRACIGVCPHAT